MMNIFPKSYMINNIFPFNKSVAEEIKTINYIYKQIAIWLDKIGY